MALLSNVVRLADYMCCEAGVALLLGSLEQLRAAMEAQPLLLTQASGRAGGPGGQGDVDTGCVGCEAGAARLRLSVLYCLRGAGVRVWGEAGPVGGGACCLFLAYDRDAEQGGTKP